MNNHIPDSELELAQEVGKLLGENRSVRSIDDPLMDQIVDHKQGLYSAFENELSESRQRSWEKVSSKIHSGQHKSLHNKSNHETSSLGRATFLKAAAAILVAVLLSIFIFTQIDVNQPEIVAESGSTQMTYTLDDQSQVQLRPNSTLFVVEQSDEIVRYQLEGEAFFNVTKDSQRRFLVDAGPGVIEVTGTSFNIREWGDETVVYLQEGSLILNTSTLAKDVYLEPGQAARVSSDLSISEPVPSDGTEFISWQQNEIVFNNRTVNSIIKELEYHYSIDIQVPKHLENEILGGTLSLESKSISLENLGIVLGGNFSSIGDDTYQFVE